MKRVFILIIIIIINWLVTSCWAPKCPEKACHVKFEHIHEGFAYRGTKKDSRMYMPWNKPENFGVSNRKAVKEKEKESKKYGKLFDWERE